MAAYNAEKTIEQAIISVLNQTYTNFELIVVDDCSIDSTCEIINRYKNKDSRIKLIENKHNLGVSHTRHKGIQNISGKWIAFLDSDDAWNVEKLEKQLNLQMQTGAKLLFTGSTFMDEDGSPIDWYLHAPQKITYKELLKQNLLSNSSSLVLAELYKQNEAVGNHMHEDFASWLQIMRHGIDAYGVDEPLLIYRISKNSKSGNKLKAAKMNWNTYRYVGLNLLQSFYYMCWYTVNGVLKYRNLNRRKYNESLFY